MRPCFLTKLQRLLSGMINPVILLEGTRQLPAEKRQALADVGKHLAESFPQAVFRSGNATGTDEAFAAGVATVSGSKLQLVLPTPGMGRDRRPANAVCHAAKRKRSRKPAPLPRRRTAGSLIFTFAVSPAPLPTANLSTSCGMASR
jgi:hypothetical protein